MGDKSKIEWTDATKIYDRDGRRCRIYVRKCPDRPGTQKRRQMLNLGLKWCRGCKDWLESSIVTPQGTCRPCANTEARIRFATDPNYRAARQAHRHRRRHGVERVPQVARDMLAELFDGECAYCPAPATTWDHVTAVTKGGLTVEGNILPACSPCNSKKRNKDIDVWLAQAPAVKPYTIEYLAVVGGLR